MGERGLGGVATLVRYQWDPEPIIRVTYVSGPSVIERRVLIITRGDRAARAYCAREGRGTDDDDRVSLKG